MSATADSLLQFRQRFMMLMGVSAGLFSTVFAVLFVVVPGFEALILPCVVGVVNSLVVIGLAASRRVDLAAVQFGVGVVMVCKGVEYLAQEPHVHGVSEGIFVVLFVVLVFVGRLWVSGVFVAASVLGTGFITADQLGEADQVQVLVRGFGEIAYLTMALVATLLLKLRYESLLVDLHARMQEIGDVNQVLERAQDLGAGRLDVRLDGGDQFSRLLVSVRDGLRDLVGEIRGSILAVGPLAGRVASAASERQGQVAQQGAALEEARRTAEEVAEAADRLAVSLQDVQKNAQMVREQVERATERMEVLRQNTAGIEELLQSIRDISVRSEVIALNAAIEGERHGEAGRAFSVVAGSMGEMSELVRHAVRDANDLLETVSAATAEASLAVQEAQVRSSQNLESAEALGREARRQGAASQQVAAMMADVDRMALALGEEAAQSLQSARELEDVVGRLERVAGRFSLQEAGS